MAERVLPVDTHAVQLDEIPTTCRAVMVREARLTSRKRSGCRRSLPGLQRDLSELPMIGGLPSDEDY